MKHDQQPSSVICIRFVRFLRWLKSLVGICPQDGCWNDCAGNHVGMCAECWNGKQEEDPYQSEDYQRFLAECAKECTCSHDICDSVLAGGVCEDIHDYHDDL